MTSFLCGGYRVSTFGYSVYLDLSCIISAIFCVSIIPDIAYLNYLIFRLFVHHMSASL